MIKLIKTATIVGVPILMGMGACSNDSVRTFTIGSHTFHVPRKHLVEGTIPWLPKSQSSGIKFIVNPDDRLEEQIIVTMEPMQRTCGYRTSSPSSQLFAACSDASRHAESGTPPKKFNIQKIDRNGDPTQWDYILMNDKGGGSSRIVASCYARSDSNGSGLCTSLSNYDDLVYSIGLRDVDVRRLPTIRSRIDGLLSSWEGRQEK